MIAKSYCYFLLAIIFFTLSCEKYEELEPDFIYAKAYGLSERKSPEENKESIMASIEASRNYDIPKTIIIESGRYEIDHINLPYDYIHIKGATVPGINSEGFPYGTILSGGRINLNNKYAPSIESLVIDLSRSKIPVIDCINSGASTEGSQNASLKNLIVLGNGNGHGILLSSGGDNQLDSIQAYNFSHGIALRSSRNVLDGFFAQNCKVSSVVVKAIADGGIMEAYGNIVRNGRCEASSLGLGAGIFLSSLGENAKCFNNHFSNISTEKVNFAIRIDGTSSIYDNTIENIDIMRPNHAGVFITGISDYNTLSNISVKNANGDSYRNNGTGMNNDVIKSYSSNPSFEESVGHFRVFEML